VSQAKQENNSFRCHNNDTIFVPSQFTHILIALPRFNHPHVNIGDIGSVCSARVQHTVLYVLSKVGER
jgi:hypothetical protein